MTEENEKVEWAKLIWQEYEYRHGLYWKSIYLWGGAAIALFIAPFLELTVKDLGSAVFIFPVLGWAISLMGTLHLASESARLGVVISKYNELRGNLKPKWPYSDSRRTWLHQAVTESIGSAVTLTFGGGLTAFAFVDVLFLLILKNPQNWKLPFYIALAIVLGFGLFIYFLVNKKKKKHNIKISTKDNSKSKV